MGGTHAFSGGGSTTLYAVSNKCLLSVGYASLLANAALGAGVFVFMEFDGVPLVVIGPVGGLVAATFPISVKVGTNVVLAISPTASATVQWAFSGEET